MSASSKKKLRKEQNAAQLTERQRREQSEAKKLKLTSIIFIVIMAAVVLTALTVMSITAVKNSGIIEKNAVVATVDDHKINAIEANYYFTDLVNSTYSQWNSTYGDQTSLYMSMMGLDLAKPLNEQQYGEDQTWADYFLESALDQAKADYALYEQAVTEGFQLPEEDQSNLDSSLSTMELYAQLYGYTKADDYLRAMYGAGSSMSTYRTYAERSALASAYYNAHSDSLTYDDAAIREYEKDSYNDYSSFSYASYYLPISSFEAEDAADTTEEATEAVEDVTEATEEVTEATEEVTEAAEEVTEAAEEATEAAEEATEATEEVTEATENAAQAAAKAAAESLLSATTVEELDAAIAALEINAENPTAASTKADNALYTGISTIYREWLAEEGRTENDIQLFANESTSTDEDGNETTTINGYYVVMYQGYTDNAQPMSNVRHLLVKFEGGTTDENGTTTYSDEEKATAKAEADGYLETWLAGDKTEESFIELVKEHSDDSSASEGGLFEDIHPASSYVENFLNWSIDDSRKAGDAEVIETEYGYHVMYYVGDDDMTYRDYMIVNNMRSADLQTWYDGIVDAHTLTILDTSRVHLDKIISAE